MNALASFSVATPGQRLSFVTTNTNTKSPGNYRSSAQDFVDFFYSALKRWQSETKFLSDPAKMTQHPSYGILLENAEKVLPLIKMELTRRPSFLVWVLEDYFGFDPYAPGDEGDIKRQTERWLSYLEASE